MQLYLFQVDESKLAGLVYGQLEDMSSEPVTVHSYPSFLGLEHAEP